MCQISSEPDARAIAEEVLLVNGSIKSMLAVVAFAAATVVAADAVLGRIVVLPRLEYETSDAIRDYKRGDPDVLILGSSYARSLIPFAHWLGEQTPGLQAQIVPIEDGRFYSYNWLLEHRLAPLIDEVDEAGRRVRSHLRHFVLVTNPYDMCGNDRPYPNLPARAWDVGDYLGDVLAHGVTPYNNNFIDQLLNEWGVHSTLLRDRGRFHVIRDLRERISPRSAQVLADEEAIRVAGWTTGSEGWSDLTSPNSQCRQRDQRDALEKILQYVGEHQLDVTIVLWPTLPKALSPTLIAQNDYYRVTMEGYAQKYGVRVVSLQDAKVVLDSDFRKDLDHLEPWGNEKVKQWALVGPFKHLAELAKGAHELR